MITQGQKCQFLASRPYVLLTFLNPLACPIPRSLVLKGASVPGFHTLPKATFSYIILRKLSVSVGKTIQGLSFLIGGNFALKEQLAMSGDILD